LREIFSYKGLFWLPENPDDKVSGTLSFSPEDGITLELIGFLGSRRSSAQLFETKIINGFSTNGKKLSLFKCYESNRTASYPGIETSIIQANYLFVGANFINEDEICFNKVAIKLKNLDSWLGISGFDIQYNQAEHSTNIYYKLPQPIEFKINSGYKAKFEFISSGPSISIYTRKASIEQSVYLILEPLDKTDRHFKELLKQTHTFQMFITFATFTASFPLEIIFYSPRYFIEFDSKKIPEEIQLYYTTSIKPKNKEIFHWDLLFSYQDIEKNFKVIINNWYTQHDKINSILGLFLVNFYNPGIFNVNRFLNIAQALETFHRRFKKNNVLPKNQHKERLKTIINSVDKKFKEWLKQKLSFSNEPTLKERIDELLKDYSNQTIQKLIKDFDNFSKLVKDSRNYYTHYDKSLEKKAAKGEDLYYLTERMKVLLTCCLLNVIGFDNNLIQELLKRNKYRLYNHLY
jgi:hypothetical protein